MGLPLGPAKKLVASLRAAGADGPTPVATPAASPAVAVAPAPASPSRQLPSVPPNAAGGGIEAEIGSGGPGGGELELERRLKELEAGLRAEHAEREVALQAEHAEQAEQTEREAALRAEREAALRAEHAEREAALQAEHAEREAALQSELRLQLDLQLAKAGSQLDDAFSQLVVFQAQTQAVIVERDAALTRFAAPADALQSLLESLCPPERLGHAAFAAFAAQSCRLGELVDTERARRRWCLKALTVTRTLKLMCSVFLRPACAVRH